MSAPPAELQLRVAAYIEQQGLLPPGGRVLALVSGGADSLCLWGVLRELGYEVEALHVEPGLRGAAGPADAAYCASLGAQVVAVDVAHGGNIEARAREARYSAAREHADGRPIATGHTMTDQAETVVYRLTSSSGPRALRAMRPAANGIVRPLLSLTATDTRAWCRDRGLRPRLDETNGDTSLRRNLIRREVMPALARVHPGAEANLARSAELVGGLDELLAEVAGEHRDDPLDRGRLSSLPRPLRVLVLREAAERAAGRPLRLPRQLTGRLEQVAGRRTGSERLSLAADLEAVRERSALSFGRPARYPQRP